MKLYRYDAHFTGSDWNTQVHVHCYDFNVIRETPCGYWIENFSALLPKWVSKTGKKRYAYPTKDEARASYYARKQRQVTILTEQLHQAQMAYNTVINCV